MLPYVNNTQRDNKVFVQWISAAVDIFHDPSRVMEFAWTPAPAQQLYGYINVDVQKGSVNFSWKTEISSCIISNLYLASLMKLTASTVYNTHSCRFVATESRSDFNFTYDLIVSASSGE